MKGIKFGRKRSVDRGSVLALHQKDTGATEIARQLSIARSTVYKILEEWKAGRWCSCRDNKYPPA